MALSPWPTAPDALEAALDALKAQGIAGDDARLGQLAAMVSLRVEKEAPSAPEIAKDEAVVRGVAYLLEARGGALIRKEVDALKTEFFVGGHLRWWYRSGASSIIAPWYVPRAGIIG